LNIAFEGGRYHEQYRGESTQEALLDSSPVQSNTRFSFSIFLMLPGLFTEITASPEVPVRVMTRLEAVREPDPVQKAIAAGLSPRAVAVVMDLPAVALVRYHI